MLGFFDRSTDLNLFVRHLLILTFILTYILALQDKRSDKKMAVIDVVLGFFKVVTFVYDIVTFPIYGLTQQSWKDRTKQNLGQVSLILLLSKKSSIDFDVYFRSKMLKLVSKLSHSDVTKAIAKSTKKSSLKAKLTQ